MLVNTFLASLAAKLAMATGLAVATVTTAGAAGVLPEPAQKAVASVVEATTPFALPDATADAVVDEVVDEVTTTTLGTSTTVAGEDDDEGTTDGTRKENHGLCVSTVAKNTPGGPDKGKTVSSVARSDCGKTSTTVAPTTTSSTTVTTLAPTTTHDGGRASPRAPPRQRQGANSGKLRRTAGKGRLAGQEPLMACRAPGRAHELTRTVAPPGRVILWRARCTLSPGGGDQRPQRLQVERGAGAEDEVLGAGVEVGVDVVGVEDHHRALDLGRVAPDAGAPARRAPCSWPRTPRRGRRCSTCRRTGRRGAG